METHDQLSPEQSAPRPSLDSILRLYGVRQTSHVRRSSSRATSRVLIQRSRHLGCTVAAQLQAWTRLERLSSSKQMVHWYSSAPPPAVSSVLPAPPWNSCPPFPVPPPRLIESSASPSPLRSIAGSEPSD